MVYSDLFLKKLQFWSKTTTFWVKNANLGLIVILLIAPSIDLFKSVLSHLYGYYARNNGRRSWSLCNAKQKSEFSSQSWWGWRLCFAIFNIWTKLMDILYTSTKFTAPFLLMLTTKYTPLRYHYSYMNMERQRFIYSPRVGRAVVEQN